MIRAFSLFVVGIWRSLTISVLAFLIFPVLVGRHGFSCLRSFTRGLDRSGFSSVDCFLSSLQAHDLICTPVEFLQRFAFFFLEFVP